MGQKSVGEKHMGEEKKYMGKTFVGEKLLGKKSVGERTCETAAGAEVAGQMRKHKLRALWCDAQCEGTSVGN